MKERTYLFTYLSALIIGILLLVFHADEKLYNGVIIAMGVLIGLPSLTMLVSYLLPKKNENGEVRPRPWYGIIASAAALGLGVWMVCNPAFFMSVSIYTLGAILILAGAAGVIFIVMAARPAPIQFYWLIVPIISLAAGLVVVILGPDKVAHSAALITGIVLVVYSVNGFTSLFREGKTPKAEVISEEEPAGATVTAEEPKQIEAD